MQENNKNAKHSHVCEFLLVVLGLMCVHLCKCSQTSDDSDNFIVGQCGNEGENCTTCYQALVRSLMSKDQILNLFNLSKAFFPTNSNDRPQFVIIMYRFKDSLRNENRSWYWSEKGSFFVYPLETFEYLSLFFGKASAFFTGKVTVTLDQECLHAGAFNSTSKCTCITFLLILDYLQCLYNY